MGRGTDIVGLILGFAGTAATIVWVYDATKQMGIEYNVSAKVVDKDGNPVFGAVVQVGTSTEVTDRGGVASFEPMRGGKYYVVVSASGYTPIDEVETINSDSLLEVTLQ